MVGFGHGAWDYEFDFAVDSLSESRLATDGERGARPLRRRRGRAPMMLGSSMQDSDESIK